MNRLILTLLCFHIAGYIYAQDYRTIDGSNNNLVNPNWGKAGGKLQQLCRVSFSDSIGEPSGHARPNPRMISNQVFGQEAFIPSPQNISDFGWGFGQFLDHDITFNIDTLTEVMEIDIPLGDPFFDPNQTGQQKIMMKRTDFDRSTGTSKVNPRAPVNSITSWIDGSGIYGVEDDRIDWLRTKYNGKLKVSEGNLLPYNTTTGAFDAPIDNNAPFMLLEGHPPPLKHFIAGDIRANEQPGLLSFHTLFVREHNRLCDSLLQANPNWNDEQIFQEARRYVGALMQVITYEEFLPTLGIELEEYQGYDSGVNGTIFNVFSGAAFRLGHSMVNDQILRLQENGDSLSFGSIQIKDAFFKPSILREEGGIEPLFRGMLTQTQQKFDNKVVGTLRNFLFGPPGAGGLDLMALNIARGRERGLPDYNSVREDFGLAKKTSFNEITSDEEVKLALENTYENTEDMDVWVGMVSETPFQDAVVGELMFTILKQQFEALRNGDRFYYENDPAFSLEEVQKLKATRLSDILKRNCELIGLPKDVFHVSEYPNSFVLGIIPFRNIRKIDIKAYPNPVQEQFSLSILSKSNETAFLSLTDNVGKLIREEKLVLRRGENVFNIDLEKGLLRGLYIVSLRTSDGIGQLKIVKR